ncbi:hypothetical protein MBLNU13_g03207t1 [Cladosporium sp. NU13]
MAGVRDPAFWKRFSVAVHMDEEQGEKLGAQYKDPDSWLARQNSKKKNRTMVCWCFWIFFIAFVTAVVGVIIWLVESGTFDKIGQHADGNAS